MAKARPMPGWYWRIHDARADAKAKRIRQAAARELARRRSAHNPPGAIDVTVHHDGTSPTFGFGGFGGPPPAAGASALAVTLRDAEAARLVELERARRIRR